MNMVEKAAAIIADKTLVHERVDDDKKAERLSTCEACKKLDTNARRCKVCRCFVDVKTGAKTNFNPLKMRNEITHCPQGFWGDADIANIYREIDGLVPIK